MIKITFIGAGSTIFAKSVLGDCMLAEPLQNATIALYDIDAVRLEESRLVVENLNQRLNAGHARVTTYLGKEDRIEALRGADFVVNAIQVGGYKPATVADFEIPKSFGLRQTIGDTLGIGGIFRGLRTIPVMLEIAREMEQVCPDAWLLNYTNPMAIVTGALLRGTGVNTVGLCHSVQVCVPRLLEELDISIPPSDVKWQIAGINHMAWLLELKHNGKDLYPDVRARACDMNKRALESSENRHDDMVRFEIMRHFGYYITESSEHNAEYTPWWIKSGHPDLISDYNIPLDEYPRRCEKQIADWKAQKQLILENSAVEHERSEEYASRIMEAIVNDSPARIHGNLLNQGAISNLPPNAVVEVACLVDRSGVHATYHGALPPQCAALNLTNINVQELTIQAALQGSRELVYQAAYLDPHTAAELTLNQIRSLCDQLIEAHRDYLPKLT